LNIEKFVNANLFITNGYLNYSKEGKQFSEVTESRLKQKIEKVLIEQQGQVLIPCSSKSKILEILLLLEEMFASKPRDMTAAGTNSEGQDGDTRVIYLEHMSRETLDVAKSHTSWMSLRDNAQFQDIQRGQSPFNFQFIKMISTLDEYHQYAYT
jgi:Cft2 family RNA processing exonuclease